MYIGSSQQEGTKETIYVNNLHEREAHGARIAGIVYRTTQNRHSWGDMQYRKSWEGTQNMDNWDGAQNR
jgi:hypothetical protein